MGRNLLYRLFGFGKLPKRLSPEPEGEGIVLEQLNRYAA